VRSYRKEHWFDVPKRMAFVNITREVVVAVTGGTLDFGPWERIFHGEFDGRRRKQVLVKILGE